ncbi:MAG: hypothetical protein AAF525_07240 [Pseudomonadota bacterium]
MPALDEAGHRTHLLRLIKGTLLVSIAVLYVAIVILQFYFTTWIDALIVLCFVLAGQFFRYIAGDVDRVGWQLNQMESDDADTSQLQYRLIWVVLLVIHGLNVGVLMYVWSTLGAMAIAVLAGLVAIEGCYLAIRSVNRRMGFNQASYGLPEHVELARSQEDIAARELAGKLATLKQMADDGEISVKAYEKARDRYTVRHVMKTPPR